MMGKYTKKLSKTASPLLQPGLSGIPSSSKVRPDHLVVHLDGDLTV